MYLNKEGSAVKPKDELLELIAKIASQDSPVGMDAVYVHALILDKLAQLDAKIDTLEQTVSEAVRSRNKP